MPRKIWLVMTPGVAARAHQRPEADRGRDPVGRLAGGRLGLLERGPDRGEHVRAGVAVGDRVDVEAVDLVDVGLEIRDGGPERLEEPGPVAGPAPHQATSVPLSARSRGRIAVGSSCDHRRAARRRAGGAARPRGSPVAGPPGRGPVGPRSGSPNRPVGRPRRPARPGRRRGRAPGRGRRRDARAEPGLDEVEAVEEPGDGPPAKPVTPYDPSVALRTTSTMARRVTSERPVVCSGGTRATSSSRWRVGRRPAWAPEAVWYPTASVRARTSSDPPKRTPEDHEWPAPAPSAARLPWPASTPSRRG